MTELSIDHTRHASRPLLRRRPAFLLLGIISVIGLACAPAVARDKSKVKAQLKKESEHVGKEPFGHIPKGPLQIVISVNQQTLHLYSDGVHVADALVATGVPEHPTPLGVFSIVGKEIYHESNIYSSAPMPYMQRITWSGVAIHQGVGVGHPASHGCIRIPREFAQRLWALTKLGARVIIARPELMPEEFADPHLFTRQVNPPAAAAPAAPAAVEAVKTAQTVDDGLAASSISSDASAATAAHADAANEGAPDGTATAMATDELRPTLGAAPENVPLPRRKPAEIGSAGRNAPIAIFVSRKTSKIYVRQDFEPMFEAPVTIAHPDEPFGTHVFTAMQFMGDGATLRWTAISLPGDPPKAAARIAEKKLDSGAKDKRRGEPAAVLDPPPPQTPKEVLARIDIPHGVIDQISALITPGSSLVVSDQGLGEETGEGTDFIVVTPVVAPVGPRGPSRMRPHHDRRAENAGQRDGHAHHRRRPDSPAAER
jgi:L,D-transpeptidase-like protein